MLVCNYTIAVVSNSNNSNDVRRACHRVRWARCCSSFGQQTFVGGQGSETGKIVPTLKGPVADQEPCAAWREVQVAPPASSEEVGELWGSSSPLLISLAQDASPYPLLHPAQALSSRKPALTMGLPTLLFLGTPAALMLSWGSRASAIFIASVFGAKDPPAQLVCIPSGA